MSTRLLPRSELIRDQTDKEPCHQEAARDVFRPERNEGPAFSRFAQTWRGARHANLQIRTPMLTRARKPRPYKHPITRNQMSFLRPSRSEGEESAFRRSFGNVLRLWSSAAWGALIKHLHAEQARLLHTHIFQFSKIRNCESKHLTLRTRGARFQLEANFVQPLRGGVRDGESQRRHLHCCSCLWPALPCVRFRVRKEETGEHLGREKKRSAGRTSPASRN